MDEMEARAKHEQNLLALVGEQARLDRNVLDIVRNAAHSLYLRDERIRQLEKCLEPAPRVRFGISAPKAGTPVVVTGWDGLKKYGTFVDVVDRELAGEEGGPYLWKIRIDGLERIFSRLAVDILPEVM
jgi:hypothetical protein